MDTVIIFSASEVVDLSTLGCLRVSGALAAMKMIPMPQTRCFQLMTRFSPLPELTLQR